MADAAAVNGSLDDVNVVSQELLPTPEEVHARLPLTDSARETVLAGRRTVQAILDRRDPRVFLVVGPCSIHDMAGARDYAKRLKALADRVSDSVVVIMRVYFEKPRTTVGWKGFINDPYMDDSFRIDEGLYNARQLLLECAEMGLPTATEALDPIIPQYISDLITWTAIGARTTESQTHREMASGLSTPVGFKNGTDGSLTTAINALHSVANPHSFLGINYQGQCSIVRTRGNGYGHIVLRGGGGSPNYDSVNIAMCEQELQQSGLPANIVVDCSHANCSKDPALQPLVLDNLVNQITEGNRSLVGMMVESNIGWGNQKLTNDVTALEYGVSITDPCIDWETTERAVVDMDTRIRDVLAQRAS